MGMTFLDSTDGDRLKELVKKAGSSTKVTVAVGGWTFSQGASKDVFSTMIGSSSNRAKFIASAKSFISSYGIAGIDIDFEYPASVERGGPPSDTPNLTAFFKELRAGLGASAVISLATPAGYWFLKGFELDKIAPQLSFINVMSYDYRTCFIYSSLTF
jgi:GH18 family chitinase